MNQRIISSGVLTCAVALGAAIGGCATQPTVNAHIESVNAEYRQLEDYVYCLEDENARLEQRNKELQANYNRVRSGQPPKENGGLLRRPGSSGADVSPSVEPPSIEIPGLEASPPRSRLQRPALDEPAGKNPAGDTLDLEPPSIEIPALPGESARPPGTTAPAPPATDDLPRPATPTTPTTPTKAKPGVPELLPVKPADPQVTHIHLNPLMTGGADFDGQPGDEGLSVLLEPRNAADEFVPTAGAVTVVVLDPAKQGDAARVARWDFTLSAAQQKLAATSATRGIQFEMPWPATPPASNKLKLFVRYEGPDGRQLQSDRDLYITPPGQIAQRWTPRPAERARPASTVAVAAKIAEEVAATPAAAAVASTGSPPALKELKSAPKLVSPPAALSGEPEPVSRAADWSPFR